MSPFSSITTTTVCPILPGLMGIWQKRQIGGTPKSKSTRPRSTSTWDRHPVPFRAVRGRHDPSIADERAPAEDEHWRQLYENRSSRKIDSRILFSRKWVFWKTFSLTENQFSREDLFIYNSSLCRRCTRATRARPAASSCPTSPACRPGRKSGRKYTG